MRPTVLIVDDHAAFRASARALLQAEGFDVVGEAANGAEAISSRDAAAYGPRLQATPARGFIPKRGLSGEALAALIG